MQVKIFDESHEKDLEDSINTFLKADIDVVDIKYQVSISILGEEQLYCFTAMVMYRK